MQFRASIFALARPQNLFYPQTFYKYIVKPCSNHPKTNKSVKNRKSKIFTGTMLSSYVECKRKLKRKKNCSLHTNLVINNPICMLK